MHLAHLWTAASVSLMLALDLSATSAAAAYTKSQLACRNAIVKGGSKLASTAYKTVASCHKGRDRDGGAAATDCNDLAQADAAKHKVSKAVDKLSAAAAGASSKCSGLTPAEIGYHQCPAPCDGDVAAIDDFANVAQCLTCLLEARVSAIATSALGSPAPPLAKSEAKCHATLSKTQGKQLSLLLKIRNKCQGKAEKAGAVTLASCIGGADTAGDAAVTKTRGKADLAIAIACLPADRSSLDTCDPVSLSGLQACVLDDGEAAGEYVFASLHGLGSPGPTTTVPTSTTTTTTLAAATWTEVQSILAGNCAGAACHTGGGSSGGMSGLDDYDTGYANTVNADSTCAGTGFVKRVVPGDSANSFLMRKLDWTQDCGPTMPFGGSQLPQPTRDRIRSWIDSGAPKN